MPSLKEPVTTDNRRFAAPPLASLRSPLLTCRGWHWFLVVTGSFSQRYQYSTTMAVQGGTTVESEMVTFSPESTLVPAPRPEVISE